MDFEQHQQRFFYLISKIQVNADVKLPIMYLIDSIVKNVGRDYKTLFKDCIVNLFCGVFEKVSKQFL